MQLLTSENYLKYKDLLRPKWRRLIDHCATLWFEAITAEDKTRLEKTAAACLERGIHHFNHKRRLSVTSVNVDPDVRREIERLDPGFSLSDFIRLCMRNELDRLRRLHQGEAVRGQEEQIERDQFQILIAQVRQEIKGGGVGRAPRGPGRPREVHRQESLQQKQEKMNQKLRAEWKGRSRAGKIPAAMPKAW